MDLEFSGTVIEWRGPAPYYFVALPENEAGVVDDHKSLLTYGWGVIPVVGQVGDTRFTTSLFPRDGGYLLPLKDAVRRAEGIVEGDPVELRLTLEIGDGH
ncbi:protein of unknown function [Pedococcus dokdonensis]|uniref:DUF1905 domain-containing protein n=1 Tax=Pedococcus dokdonensis TaxID=443156 RepID=A0A1H0QR24_9MICO|nr:DUF1905 domain-containing protein [Pedococcus dokdonensis]SDP19783.1 protein of unknown function [Pedococcus dokdonensis]